MWQRGRVKLVLFAGQQSRNPILPSQCFASFLQRTVVFHRMCFQRGTGCSSQGLLILHTCTHTPSKGTLSSELWSVKINIFTSLSLSLPDLQHFDISFIYNFQFISFQFVQLVHMLSQDNQRQDLRFVETSDSAITFYFRPRWGPKGRVFLAISWKRTHYWYTDTCIYAGVPWCIISFT